MTQMNERDLDHKLSSLIFYELIGNQLVRTRSPGVTKRLLKKKQQQQQRKMAKVEK